MSGNTPQPPAGQDPFQPPSGTDPFAQQPSTPPPPPPAPSGPGTVGVPPAPQAPAGGMPGYGSMPGAPMGAPAGPVEAPASILTAVKLMRVGAGLSVLGVLSNFLFRDQARAAAEESLKQAGRTVDDATLDAALNLGMGLGVAMGLITVGLWLWMASTNGKGKTWARTVATVLFALSLVSFLASMTQALPMVARILSIVNIAVGAAALYFLYRPDSKAFYQASSAPRY